MSVDLGPEKGRASSTEAFEPQQSSLQNDHEKTNDTAPPTVPLTPSSGRCYFLDLPREPIFNIAPEMLPIPSDRHAAPFFMNWEDPVPKHWSLLSIS
ncbi:hypothetical protein EK21DRAFT_119702 [Setomelanomma holmii]|uniref:Uncharacterized protein n=1 Tax=Setomelanomma holmii TaxID=210430 RepID=A0A9P4GVI0_9PLEO|nr:hypothetical protein EK21DRAFT_119702 [Setomelanomma holmii]